MKITKDEFLNWDNKVITLMGMSGVGKSYVAAQLAEWGWFNYSCDHLIGTKYLSAYVDGAVSADNILNLSEFVGQIGGLEKGGVGLDEFARRQKMYYDAEVSVLRDMPVSVDAAPRKFVNDSSGSMCEVEDEDVLRAVGEKSLLIYLKVGQEDHAEILERAIKYPKPLYFPPAFFADRLAKFQSKFDITDIEEIDPYVFLSWVFPHLFESRLPKYQALADEHGVTISVGAFSKIKSEEEFIAVVAEALS